MTSIITWDSSFELKTLSPRFVDAVNVESPQNLHSGEHFDLEFAAKSLILTLAVKHVSTPATYCSVKVGFSTVENGALSNGHFIVDSDMGKVEFPLRDVTFAKITYLAGTDVNVSFCILLG